MSPVTGLETQNVTPAVFLLLYLYLMSLFDPFCPCYLYFASLDQSQKAKIAKKCHCQAGFSKDIYILSVFLYQQGARDMAMVTGQYEAIG